MTGFQELLSVLFGTGIRSSRDRIPSCFGTPFLPVLARSALFYPLFRPELLRKWPETGQKVACFQPFCRLLMRKTCFSAHFLHLLSIQAAPLITSGTNSVVTFHGKVTKRTDSCPSLNQPKSVKSCRKVTFSHLLTPFVTLLTPVCHFCHFQPCPRLGQREPGNAENNRKQCLFCCFLCSWVSRGQG